MTPKTRILVVEDELGLSLLISEVLEGAGCSVVTARDGMEAVEVLGLQRFDIVLTDINMPRMNGLDLLRWMKAAGRRETVMVMTGSPEHETLHAEGLPPVAAHFRKPFRLPELVESVERRSLCCAAGTCSECLELKRRSA